MKAGIAVALFVLACAVWAMAGTNRTERSAWDGDMIRIDVAPEKKIEPARPAQTNVLDKLKAEGNLVTTARLAIDYGDNQVRADLRYKGKLLVIQGKVRQIASGNFGESKDRSALMLDNEVACLFQFGQEEKIAKLDRGVDVIVIGVCRGLMGSAGKTGILFDSCVLPKVD